MAVACGCVAQGCYDGQVADVVFLRESTRNTVPTVLEHRQRVYTACVCSVRRYVYGYGYGRSGGQPCEVGVSVSSLHLLNKDASWMLFYPRIAGLFSSRTASRSEISAYAFIPE